MATRTRTRTDPNALPEVTISEDGEVRFLHLGTEWIQGSMIIDSPFEIELEYVQRMMAWLLFVEPDSVSARHSMQLGLGSGALTKFHFKKLKMDTTTIEINPQVVVACRTWFKLPPDSAKLRVLLGDAAEVVRHAPFHGTIDALQVDLYDHEAAAPVLDSPDFYADCRNALATDRLSVMAVNLFGKHKSCKVNVDNIARAFDGRVLALPPSDRGNVIVFGFAGTDSELLWSELRSRAAALRAATGLEFSRWLTAFRQSNAHDEAGFRL